MLTAPLPVCLASLVVEILISCYLRQKRDRKCFILTFNLSDCVLCMCVCVYKCVCVYVSCSVMSSSFQLHGLEPIWFLCPWDSPGKNTGVGCHDFFFQGIFATQRLNPHLLHCRQILYSLSHLGNPRLYTFAFCCCSVAKSCPTFATPWTAACQASLSLTVYCSLPKFMSTESATPSNHLIL